VQNFTFQRPASLADASAALRETPDAKLLGGGQSLVPILKLGLAQPPVVISLRGIAGLSGIRRDGKSLVVGAAATHAEVAASATVRDAIPALADLASRIGDAQVRNRGTLGGSIAHADPAADYPAALLGLDATVATDRREIAAADFFNGVFQTALEPDEIVTAVRFPIPESAAYAKFPNPASRFAIAGVFVARTAGGVRVAVTGAGTQPFRATALESALSEHFEPSALVGVTIASDDLVSDLHASAEFRAHLVSVLARRAVASIA